MTEDVLAHGDDRPPRRFGGLLAGVAAFALLGVGVAGALRSPEPAGDAAPSPSASRTAGWTEYPPSESPPKDPFAEAVLAQRPEPGGAISLLLADDAPVLLVHEPQGLAAYTAIGGPTYAPVLLGWCPRNGTLQDAGNRFRYLNGLASESTLRPLQTYPVRPSGADAEIAAQPNPDYVTSPTAHVDDGCARDELVMPRMPARSRNLFRPGAKYAVMGGRYVVSVESRAFCPAAADARCESSGWEQYGPHTVLPPGDLASAYTWEGDFLVRTDPGSGAIDVVLTPTSRLVKRDRAGVSVRVGWAESWQTRGGSLRLAFNPFRTEGVPDDSPAGTPRPAVRDLVDQRGGLVTYTVLPDAEVYLGRGITGLGKPRGTPATLRAYLERVKPYVGPPLWLVLDARGRVIRAVLAPEEG